MSSKPRKTAARVAAFACDIIRHSPRGDWFATLPRAAFAAADVDPDAGYVAAVDADTCRVRFGGRAGAMVAAIPDANRADAVVASVVAFRAMMADGYATFARPGAIDSPAVAVGSRIGTTRADGSRVRDAIGRVPASRRVASVTASAAKWADELGGDASAYATTDA